MELDLELINIEKSLSNENIGDQFLIETLKKYKKEWELFLKVGCSMSKKNYHKTIAEILINSGFECKDPIKFENKIKVYLSRIK